MRLTAPLECNMERLVTAIRAGHNRGALWDIMRSITPPRAIDPGQIGRP